MTYDVIVVGGGAAGLTAAAYTSRAGLKTLLVEKNTGLGGLVQSVTRNGFTFDMGLRAIEDSGIVLPMLKDLGIEMEFVKSRVSIGIGDDVIPVTSQESVELYQRFLERHYPESKDDIAQVIKIIKGVMKDMEVLYKIENPIFKDLKTDYNFVFKTLLPWMFKFIVTIGRINRMNQPVETLLDGISDNVSLKRIIGQHFFKKTPAFFAMSYFSVYLDYQYPIGGTGTITALLQKYIEHSGVEVKYGRSAVALDPEAKTIRTETRESFEYRNLIWCADLKSLYNAINIGHIKDPRLMEKVVTAKEALAEHRGGDSVFSLFLSVNERPEYFASKSEGHFFYTPDSRGLGNLHTDSLQELIGSRADSSGFPGRVKAFIEEFFKLTTYEISIPVLKDRNMAPHGKTGLIISCLFDYELVRLVSDDGWYDEFTALCSDWMIRALSRSIYPRLEEKILDSFAATPLSIERRTGNSDGAITGWAFTGREMPVVNKMQHVSKSVLTPVKDVYQAGQWTYSPSGLPMAFLTGKLAADKVRKTGPARPGPRRNRNKPGAPV